MLLNREESFNFEKAQSYVDKYAGLPFYHLDQFSPDETLIKLECEELKVCMAWLLRGNSREPWAIKHCLLSSCSRLIYYYYELPCNENLAYPFQLFLTLSKRFSLANVSFCNLWIAFWIRSIALLPFTERGNGSFLVIGNGHGPRSKCNQLYWDILPVTPICSWPHNWICASRLN